MAITIKQRAFAGFWFMGAAALVVLPIIVPFATAAESSSESTYYLIWFVCSPLLMAGLVGFLLGGSILEARRDGSGWRAALRGLFIAVIAYLLYAVVFSAWEGYANHGAFSPGEAFTQTLILVLMWGAILFGWVVAIVGALAGWFLHFISGARWKRSGLR